MAAAVMDLRTALQFLGLSAEEANYEDAVRSAWRARARDCHPDKHTGKEEEFLQLQKALELVSKARENGLFNLGSGTKGGVAATTDGNYASSRPRGHPQQANATQHAATDPTAEGGKVMKRSERLDKQVFGTQFGSDKIDFRFFQPPPRGLLGGTQRGLSLPIGASSTQELKRLTAGYNHDELALEKHQAASSAQQELDLVRQTEEQPVEPPMLQVVWRCTLCEPASSSTCCRLKPKKALCICGHKLEDHNSTCGSKCKKCPCKGFQFHVQQGAWEVRCSCKHKRSDHKPTGKYNAQGLEIFACQGHVPGQRNKKCPCKCFEASWVCNCGHPWSAHETVVTVVPNRALFGREWVAGGLRVECVEIAEQARDKWAGQAAEQVAMGALNPEEAIQKAARFTERLKLSRVAEAKMQEAVEDLTGQLEAPPRYMKVIFPKQGIAFRTKPQFDAKSSLVASKDQIFLGQVYSKWFRVLDSADTNSAPLPRSDNPLYLPLYTPDGKHTILEEVPRLPAAISDDAGQLETDEEELHCVPAEIEDYHLDSSERGSAGREKRQPLGTTTSQERSDRRAPSVGASTGPGKQDEAGAAVSNFPCADGENGTAFVSTDEVHANQATLPGNNQQNAHSTGVAPSGTRSISSATRSRTSSFSQRMSFASYFEKNARLFSSLDEPEHQLGQETGSSAIPGTRESGTLPRSIDNVCDDADEISEEQFEIRDAARGDDVEDDREAQARASLWKPLTAAEQVVQRPPHEDHADTPKILRENILKVFSPAAPPDLSPECSGPPSEVEEDVFSQHGAASDKESTPKSFLVPAASSSSRAPHDELRPAQKILYGNRELRNELAFSQDSNHIVRKLSISSPADDCGTGSAGLNYSRCAAVSLNAGQVAPKLTLLKKKIRTNTKGG
ncbi:unnamed protein product [Amoebophrya sp. A120]|nr:unnamed protein product [Amoebophrya sp. A120]|eukprot:GSA120T00004768001.1